MPASARPLGVERSSASVNETNATPRAVSSFIVSNEVGDRAAPAIELPDEDGIELASACRDEELVALRAFAASEATSRTVRTIFRPRRAANSSTWRTCSGTVAGSRGARLELLTRLDERALSDVLSVCLDQGHAHGGGRGFTRRSPLRRGSGPRRAEIYS
jgi:hypothetical protein